MKKRLYKGKDKMLSGVCSGIADYFGIDPTIIRLAYVALSVFSAGFPGIILYIVMAVIMPDAPADEYYPSDDEVK